MVEVGFFSLCFGFCLSLFGLLMGIYTVFRPFSSIVASARNALISVFICVFISSLIMWDALFFHDFSLKYVYRNSSLDMPPLYLFTSFWSALEGSHLLWTLIMSAIVTIALVTVKKENFSLYPALCVAFGFALTFMMFLNVSFSAPLERLSPVGKFGEGMNALLQNPYMAIHPPMLFTGYCLLIVPFAYSFAVLVKGSFTSEWLATVRRWSLLAWAVLSVAICLGGKWAYVELGWGGYWGWDPVENSSFMPWLAITAALHTLLITDKTGRLPRLLLFLNMFAFSLTFLGTFITRSGIISSVHSFAESEIGPSYLIWVMFLLLLTVCLVFTRGNYIQGAAVSNEWRISKESALLFTIFFILFLLALVLIGTILPLIVEATRGIKISIQQPFFNAFAPWIGASLVLLLGVGNLMRWKNGKIADPISCLLFPFIWAIILTYSLAVQKNFDKLSALTFLIVLWTCGVLIMDLIYKLKSMRWNGKIFLLYNRPYLGAFIIHIGFLFAIIGFAGNYRGLSAEAHLGLNESTVFNNYKITNEGLGYTQEYNAQYVYAKIKSENKQNGESILITPMRSKFTNNEQWFNEIGIHSTFWHDLYIVLSSFDINNQSVSLKINWNPTVKFVWTSLVIMVIGALISLTHRIRKRSLDISDNFSNNDKKFSIDDILEKSSENKLLKTSNLAKSMSVSIIGFIIFVVLFGLSGVSLADQLQKNDNSFNIPKENLKNNLLVENKISGNGNVMLTVENPKLEEIAKELRCPTCIGISVLESNTLQSQAMRTEIINQLAEGKSKEEIIHYFKTAYGPWILREPDAQSPLGFMIWGIPILGFLLGPIFILLSLKYSKKKKINEELELINEIKEYIEKKKCEVVL